jgi:hypothetical protein
MPSQNPFSQRIRRARQVLCPFCKEQVPAPRRVRAVFTPEGCLAARCSCGAVYAVDETGRLGGQALLDAQAVLCEGDLRLAMTLETGKHVDVRSRPFGIQKIHDEASRFNRTSGSSRAWFVRRRTPAKTEGS